MQLQTKLRHAVALALLAALAGPACAQLFRVPASELTRQGVQATHGVLVAPQDAIDATYQKSNSRVSSFLSVMPGVGLIDAMIFGAIEGQTNATRNDEARKQAEINAAPVRRALDGYDFRAKMQVAMQERLAPIGWLNVARVAWGRPGAKSEELRKDVQEPALLMLHLRYSLSATMRSVRLWCNAYLLPNDSALREIAARERPNERTAYLYRNEFMFIETLAGPPVPPMEAAARWGENDGARIRAALDQAIKEIAEMLASDIDDVGAAPANPGKPMMIEKATTTMLSESENRALIRMANGTLRSVPKALLSVPEPAIPEPVRPWERQ